jgi:hypothetical protein
MRSSGVVILAVNAKVATVLGLSALIHTGNFEGTVAKSYMTSGLLICGKIFEHFLIYQEFLPHL